MVTAKKFLSLVMALLMLMTCAMPVFAEGAAEALPQPAETVQAVEEQPETGEPEQEEAPAPEAPAQENQPEQEEPAEEEQPVSSEAEVPAMVGSSYVNEVRLYANGQLVENYNEIVAHVYHPVTLVAEGLDMNGNKVEDATCTFSLIQKTFYEGEPPYEEKLENDGLYELTENNELTFLKALNFGNQPTSAFLVVSANGDRKKEFPIRIPGPNLYGSKILFNDQPVQVERSAGLAVAHAGDTFTLDAKLVDFDGVDITPKGWTYQCYNRDWPDTSEVIHSNGDGTFTAVKEGRGAVYLNDENGTELVLFYVSVYPARPASDKLTIGLSGSVNGNRMQWNKHAEVVAWCGDAVLNQDEYTVRVVKGEGKVFLMNGNTLGAPPVDEDTEVELEVSMVNDPANRKGTITVVLTPQKIVGAEFRTYMNNVDQYHIQPDSEIEIFANRTMKLFVRYLDPDGDSVGGFANPQVTISDSNVIAPTVGGSYPTVGGSYPSANKEVTIGSSGGMVSLYAAAAGTANVTFNGNGRSDKVTIKVKPVGIGRSEITAEDKKTGAPLNISDDSITTVVNSEISLLAQYYDNTPEGEPYKAQPNYKSSNPEVASVSDLGVVTALAAGETDITLTAEDHVDTIHLTVVDTAPVPDKTTMTISPIASDRINLTQHPDYPIRELSVDLGELVAQYECAYNGDVNWFELKPAYYVYPGQYSVGLNVKYGDDQTVTIPVTVTSYSIPPEAELSLNLHGVPENYPENTVYAGDLLYPWVSASVDGQNWNAELSDPDQITFSTDAEGAFVNENGSIRLPNSVRQETTITITGTLVNDPDGRTVSRKYTLVPVVATGMKVHFGERVLEKVDDYKEPIQTYVGKQTQIRIEMLGNKPDGSYFGTPPMTFSSNNEKVATVSRTGMVNIVGKGEAEITIKGADMTRIIKLRAQDVAPVMEQRQIYLINNPVLGDAVRFTENPDYTITNIVADSDKVINNVDMKRMGGDPSSVYAFLIYDGRANPGEHTIRLTVTFGKGEDEVSMDYEVPIIVYATKPEIADVEITMDGKVVDKNAPLKFHYGVPAQVKARYLDAEGKEIPYYTSFVSVKSADPWDPSVNAYVTMDDTITIREMFKPVEIHITSNDPYAVEYILNVKVPEFGKIEPMQNGQLAQNYSFSGAVGQTVKVGVRAFDKDDVELNLGALSYECINGAENIATIDHEGNLTMTAPGTGRVRVATYNFGFEYNLNVYPVYPAEDKLTIGFSGPIKDGKVVGGDILEMVVKCGDAVLSPDEYDIELDKDGPVFVPPHKSPFYTNPVVSQEKVTLKAVMRFDEAKRSAQTSLTIMPVEISKVTIGVSGMGMDNTDLETGSVIETFVNRVMFLTAKYFDQNNRRVGIGYEMVSSDTKTLTIGSSGRVNAVAPGTAKVQFKSGNRTDTVTVKVNPVGIGGVTIGASGYGELTDNSITTVGDQEFRITARYTDNTPEHFPYFAEPVFKSSNTRVAVVDSKGLVKTLKPGETDITLTVGDRVDTVKVTVMDIDPTVDLGGKNSLTFVNTEKWGDVLTLKEHPDYPISAVSAAVLGAEVETQTKETENGMEVTLINRGDIVVGNYKLALTVEFGKGRIKTFELPLNVYQFAPDAEFNLMVQGPVAEGLQPDTYYGGWMLSAVLRMDGANLPEELYTLTAMGAEVKEGTIYLPNVTKPETVTVVAALVDDPDGREISVPLTVLPRVAESMMVTLDQQEADVGDTIDAVLGEEFDLKVNYFDNTPFHEPVTAAANFTSGRPAVVSVDGEGHVKALAAGMTTITIKGADLTRVITVKVIDARPSFAVPSVDVKRGNTKAVELKAREEYPVLGAETGSSSFSVKLNGEGGLNLTASEELEPGVYTVPVTLIYQGRTSQMTAERSLTVRVFSFDPEAKLTLGVSGLDSDEAFSDWDVQMVAAVDGETLSKDQYTLTTTGLSGVTVQDWGIQLPTVTKASTVTVTAALKDDPDGRTADYTLKVFPRTVADMTIGASGIEGDVVEPIQTFVGRELRITPKYYDNTPRRSRMFLTSTFTSSKPAVATVNAEGLVSAKSIGETTITIKGGNLIRTVNVVVNDIVPVIDKTELNMVKGESMTETLRLIHHPEYAITTVNNTLSDLDVDARLSYDLTDKGAQVTVTAGDSIKPGKYDFDLMVIFGEDDYEEIYEMTLNVYGESPERSFYLEQQPIKDSDLGKNAVYGDWETIVRLMDDQGKEITEGYTLTADADKAEIQGNSIRIPNVAAATTVTLTAALENDPAGRTARLQLKVVPRTLAVIDLTYRNGTPMESDTIQVFKGNTIMPSVYFRDNTPRKDYIAPEKLDVYSKNSNVAEIVDDGIRAVNVGETDIVFTAGKITRTLHVVVSESAPILDKNELHYSFDESKADVINFTAAAGYPITEIKAQPTDGLELRNTTAVISATGDKGSYQVNSVDGEIGKYTINIDVTYGNGQKKTYPVTLYLAEYNRDKQIEMKLPEPLYGDWKNSCVITMGGERAVFDCTVSGLPGAEYSFLNNILYTPNVTAPKTITVTAKLKNDPYERSVTSQAVVQPRFVEKFTLGTSVFDSFIPEEDNTFVTILGEPIVITPLYEDDQGRRMRGIAATYTSANTKVATVKAANSFQVKAFNQKGELVSIELKEPDTLGLVTPVSAGETTITVKSGSMSQKAIVKVIDAKPVLDSNPVTMLAGEAEGLEITALPEYPIIDASSGNEKFTITADEISGQLMLAADQDVAPGVYKVPVTLTVQGHNREFFKEVGMHTVDYKDTVTVNVVTVPGFAELNLMSDDELAAEKNFSGYTTAFRLSYPSPNGFDTVSTDLYTLTLPTALKNAKVTASKDKETYLVKWPALTKAAAGTITAALNNDPLKRTAALPYTVEPIMVGQSILSAQDVKGVMVPDLMSKGLEGYSIDPDHAWTLKAEYADQTPDQGSMALNPTAVSSDATVAKVVKNADGSFQIIPVNYGACTITVAANDLGKWTDSIHVNIVDVTPRLPVTALTIDRSLNNRIELPVTTVPGHDVVTMDDALNNPNIRVFNDEGRWAISINEGDEPVKAGKYVLPLTMTVNGSDEEFTGTVTLTVTDTTPKTTVKVPVTNLFLRDSIPVGLTPASNAVIEEVQVIEGPYTAQYDAKTNGLELYPDNLDAQIANQTKTSASYSTPVTLEIRYQGRMTTYTTKTTLKWNYNIPAVTMTADTTNVSIVKNADADSFVTTNVQFAMKDKVFEDGYVLDDHNNVTVMLGKQEIMDAEVAPVIDGLYQVKFPVSEAGTYKVTFNDVSFEDCPINLGSKSISIKVNAIAMESIKPIIAPASVSITADDIESKQVILSTNTTLPDGYKVVPHADIADDTIGKDYFTVSVEGDDTITIARKLDEKGVDAMRTLSKNTLIKVPVDVVYILYGPDDKELYSNKQSLTFNVNLLKPTAKVVGILSDSAISKDTITLDQGLSNDWNIGLTAESDPISMAREGNPVTERISYQFLPKKDIKTWDENATDYNTPDGITFDGAHLGVEDAKAGTYYLAVRSESMYGDLVLTSDYRILTIKVNGNSNKTALSSAKGSLPMYAVDAAVSTTVKPLAAAKAAKYGQVADVEVKNVPAGVKYAVDAAAKQITFTVDAENAESLVPGSYPVEIAAVVQQDNDTVTLPAVTYTLNVQDTAPATKAIVPTRKSILYNTTTPVFNMTNALKGFEGYHAVVAADLESIGAVIPLTVMKGKAVTNDLRAEMDSNGNITVTRLATTLNGTYTVKVAANLYMGHGVFADNPVPINTSFTVSTSNKAPNVKATKQKGTAIDLAYRQSSTEVYDITSTTTGAEITNVVLKDAENSKYELIPGHYTENGSYLLYVAAKEDAQWNALTADKVALLVYFDGMEKPVETTISVKPVQTAVTAKATAAQKHNIMYQGVSDCSLTYEVAVSSKDAQLLATGDFTVSTAKLNAAQQNAFDVSMWKDGSGRYFIDIRWKDHGANAGAVKKGSTQTLNLLVQPKGGAATVGGTVSLKVAVKQ